MFFWSDVFGESGLFFSDFGDAFVYKPDQQVKNIRDEGSASQNLVEKGKHDNAIIDFSGTSYSGSCSNNSNSSSSSSRNSSSNSSGSSSNEKGDELKSIAFPPLQQVLEKKWSTIASRHFPLSPTFVASRLLAAFRCAIHVCFCLMLLSSVVNAYQLIVYSVSLSYFSFALWFGDLVMLWHLHMCNLHIIRDRHGRHAAEDDAAALSSLLRDMLEANGLPPADGTDSVLSDRDVQQLAALRGAVSVLACSVLGSFLSQEVIKAVSRTGQPAFNVFLFSGHDFSAKAVPIQ